MHAGLRAASEINCQAISTAPSSNIQILKFYTVSSVFLICCFSVLVSLGFCPPSWICLHMLLNEQSTLKYMEVYVSESVFSRGYTYNKHLSTLSLDTWPLARIMVCKMKELTLLNTKNCKRKYNFGHTHMNRKRWQIWMKIHLSSI